MIRPCYLLCMPTFLALALATPTGPTPTRAIDGHVHLTNISLFDYLWGNASAGTCPCAPPCLCSWSVYEWQNASRVLEPSRFVFVEVDVNKSQWLAEATWVQQLSVLPGGSAIGAIVAQPPPGFGTDVDVNIAQQLDKLVQLPLVHGVRPSISWASLNDTTYATLLAHTQLLMERNLSFDLNAALGTPGVSDWVTRLVNESPRATFIVDHIGGVPCLGNDAQVSAWKSGLAQLATLSNVAVKIGGLIQCYKSSGVLPSVSAITPFVTFALDAFGYERSFFEANWFFTNWYEPPLLDVYTTWVTDLTAILEGMQPQPTQQDVDALFFQTVSRVYRVD